MRLGFLATGVSTSSIGYSFGQLVDPSKRSSASSLGQLCHLFHSHCFSRRWRANGAAKRCNGLDVDGAVGWSPQFPRQRHACGASHSRWLVSFVPSVVIAFVAWSCAPQIGMSVAFGRVRLMRVRHDVSQRRLWILYRCPSALGAGPASVSFTTACGASHDCVSALSFALPFRLGLGTRLRLLLAPLRQ